MLTAHETALPEPAQVPPVITLISEHLDQVLAAGEDLKQLRLAPSDPAPDADLDGALPVDRFVEDAKKLEWTALMRVLRAREHSHVLKRDDARFKPVADMFLSGTAPLTDALEGMSQAHNSFETGEDPVVYLATRAVLTSDAGAVPANDITMVGEGLLLGGAVELGVLMDLVAAYLDAIEIHYDVFPEQDLPVEPLALTDETGTRGTAAA